MFVSKSLKWGGPVKKQIDSCVIYFISNIGGKGGDGAAVLKSKGGNGGISFTVSIGRGVCDTVNCFKNISSMPFDMDEEKTTSVFLKNG